MTTTSRIDLLATRGLASLFSDLISEPDATAKYLDGVGKVRIDQDRGAGENLVRITARVRGGELRLEPWGGGALMDEHQEALADLVRSIFEAA